MKSWMTLLHRLGRLGCARAWLRSSIGNVKQPVPRPPTRRNSRRVRPSHNRVAEPQIRSIGHVPRACGREGTTSLIIGLPPEVHEKPVLKPTHSGGWGDPPTAMGGLAF